MSRLRKAFIGSSLILLLGAISAHAEVEYIWSNKKGFVSAKQCRVVKVNATRFRIADDAQGRPFVDGHQASGKHFSYLLNRSMIRLVTLKNKGRLWKADVMGVTPNSELDTRRGFMSRMDQAYFEANDVKPLDNYSLKMLTVPPGASDSIGDTGEKVQDSIWHVATQDGKYVVYECGSGAGEDYVVFDVFRPDHSTPFARVGVSWNDTIVFRAIRVSPITTAIGGNVEPAATEKPKAAPQNVEIPTSDSSPTQPVVFKVVPMPRARPMIPEKTTATSTESAKSSGTTSYIEQLFGSGEIPKVSHDDVAYQRRAHGNYDKALQCRSAWRALRRQHVDVRPVRASLDQMIRKGEKMGLTATHLKKTLAVFLANQHELPNQRYITVVDYTKRSSQKRLFIVDLETGDIGSYYVSNAMGSDRNFDGYANRFAAPGLAGFSTHASSLGCYVAAGEFYGKHGLSLMLHGIESQNDYACEREIEFHPANYVPHGRSWGCMAVLPRDRNHIIALVRSGLVCAYKDGKYSFVGRRR